MNIRLPFLPRFWYGILAVMLCAVIVSPLMAQDTTTPLVQKRTQLTRSQILLMSVEELRELSLEELTELASIVGVSSVEELFDLLITTASKSEEKIIDAPGVVSVLTAREIEQFGAQTLKDALNYMTGVGLLTSFVNRNGIALRGAQQPVATNDHILILIDGRPIRENLYAGQYSAILGAFSMAGVERIEVIRGPGSVLYGTGAYVGVINLIMKKAKKPTLNASAQAGSFGTALGSLDGGFTAGNVNVYGSLNYLNQTSWEQTLQGEDPPKPQTFNYKQNGVGANLGIQFGGLKASTSVMQYNADCYDQNIKLPPSLFKQTFWNADIGYTHDITDGWKASLNGTLTQYDGSLNNQVIQSRDYIVELTNSIKPLQTMNIIVGGLTNIRNGSLFLKPPPNVGGNGYYTVEPYNQVWWSAYVQAEYTLQERIKLIAGAQVNKVETLPLNVVPRFGAIWSITDELTLKTLYGQAFRSPSAYESFLTTPPPDHRGIEGNPKLKPETTSVLDVELFYKRTNLQASLVFFYGKQDNLIAVGFPGMQQMPPMPPQGNPSFINLTTYRYTGVEFEGKYIPIEPLYILGSISYQTNLSGDRFTDASPLPNVTARLGAGYNNPEAGLSVGIMNIFYSRPRDDFGGTSKNQKFAVVNPAAEAFNLLSVNVAWDITKAFGWNMGTTHILLNARVENALDVQTWQPEWVRKAVNTLPMFPGRGLFGGISVKF